LSASGDSLERRLQTAGLFLGPALAAVLYLWNPGGHSPEARTLLSIMGLAICFWMTEAIPLPATALLATALAIVTGVAPAREVLAPYADPVIFLFIGSFYPYKGIVNIFLIYCFNCSSNYRTIFCVAMSKRGMRSYKQSQKKEK